MFAQLPFNRQRPLSFQIDADKGQHRIRDWRARGILRHFLAQHAAFTVKLHHLTVDTQLVPSTAGVR